METFHSRIVHGRCRRSSTPTSFGSAWAEGAQARSVLSALVLAAAAILWLSTPAQAAVCSTVAADGSQDFDGDTISKNFDNSTRADNEVAVNASAGTLFIGQRVNQPAKDKLYLWDKAVAASGATVPCGTGKAFKKNGVFHNPSINDSGEVGFKGLFDRGGQGVFVRESSASAIEAAACTGDLLAPGEAFASFPAVSRINASSQIAFVGTTNVSSYVFSYDAPADTLNPALISVGDPTTSGRQVCAFAAVGLGDSGEVVVRGKTDDDCTTPTDPRDSVFYTAGASIIIIAQAGAPSPIPGSDYSAFPDRNVFMNASGKMLFAAKVGGAQNKVCLFLHDPSGPSTTPVACQKDPALGGKLGIPEAYQLADSGKVCYIADVNSGGTTKQGIFCDGSSVLTLLTLAPAPFFSYTQFFDLGMSADGSRIGLDVTARDATTNKARRGIVSCTLP